MKRRLSSTVTRTMASSSGAMDTSVDPQSSMTPTRFGRKRTYSGKRIGGRKLTKRQRREVTTLITRRNELKFIGFTQGPTSVTTTGSVFVLSPVAQGSTDAERVGDRLQWCGTLEINLNWVHGGTDLQCNERVIIFQWHPNNAPTVGGAGGILLNGQSGAAGVDSCYNHDNRQLYTILYDGHFRTWGNTTPTASEPLSAGLQTGYHFVRIPMTKCQKNVQYQGGGATGTNLIYLLQITDGPPGSATHQQLTFTGKQFFRDG